MLFSLPNNGIEFEIPDDWWLFAGMNDFKLNGGRYYPYLQSEREIRVVPINEIEPPLRAQGVPPFKKYKLLPILFAFMSPECALPLVEVSEIDVGKYKYHVTNGYHRFYASLAVGFTYLPVSIISLV
jgi:hypothetical protein